MNLSKSLKYISVIIPSVLISLSVANALGVFYYDSASHKFVIDDDVQILNTNNMTLNTTSINSTSTNEFYLNANESFQIRVDADDSTDGTSDSSAFKINNGTNDTVFQVNESGVISTSSNNIKHYRNVAHFAPSGGCSDSGRSIALCHVGTMEIIMPKGWSSTIMTVKISGYQYDNNRPDDGGWSAEVSGYNYSGSGRQGWRNTNAKINGPAPFSKIRLGINAAGKNMILLGETSTVWTSPKITVTDFIASVFNIDDWDEGWSISIVDSETALSYNGSPQYPINQVTPTLNETFYGNVSILKYTALGNTTEDIFTARLVGNTNNPGLFVTANQSTGKVNLHFSGSAGYNGVISVGNT